MDKYRKLDALIEGAEELLMKLGEAPEPQVQKLRDRVDHAIVDARSAIARESAGSRVGVRDVLRTLDDYIRGYPWLAFATGVLVAGSIGYIAGAAVGSAGIAADD